MQVNQKHNRNSWGQLLNQLKKGDVKPSDVTQRSKKSYQKTKRHEKI